ncbi:hypothetical protein PVAP13_8KG133701 [Panicum virgatum]|uniref:Uncharacterized protein n=1 Tax=Panicum virgatum TaxID=38727 RepID=A0A8T0PJP9_PANVG|nr:hypothetical protein PVAP13_8KG133701 [Panicum virgatum]
MRGSCLVITFDSRISSDRVSLGNALDPVIRQGIPFLFWFQFLKQSHFSWLPALHKLFRLWSHKEHSTSVRPVHHERLLKNTKTPTWESLITFG